MSSVASVVKRAIAAPVLLQGRAVQKGLRGVAKATKRIPVVNKITGVTQKLGHNMVSGVARTALGKRTFEKASSSSGNLGLKLVNKKIENAPDPEVPQGPSQAELQGVALGKAREDSVARRRRSPGRSQSMLSRKSRGSSIIGRNSGS